MGSCHVAKLVLSSWAQAILLSEPPELLGLQACNTKLVPNYWFKKILQMAGCQWLTPELSTQKAEIRRIEV
jgi:hypothetical protein